MLLLFVGGHVGLGCGNDRGGGAVRS